MAKRQARDGWLDRLEAAPAAARIVNMSSVAYSMTKGINFDDIKLMSSTAKNPIVLGQLTVRVNWLMFCSLDLLAND